MVVYRRLVRKYHICLIFVLVIFFFTKMQLLNNRNEITHIRNKTKKVQLIDNLNKKYILLWTSAHTSPFVHLGMGNTVFVQKQCKWTNCYVTNNRKYLGYYDEFEVVAFHGPELMEYLTFGDIPNKRSDHQKYVYANNESAALKPLCTKVWNDYFNWTWTYKLNSDVPWGHFVIKNASKHVIGPNQNMHWKSVKDMDDIDDELKAKLGKKSRPIAWFVSSCVTQSLREDYVLELNEHLRDYSMTVHTYGKCGDHSCPIEQMPSCLKKLEDHYYFYLAFENSLSEDYVSEKLMYALNHNTVPIVWGGANYTRFMPDGIYLDANILEPRTLARRIFQSIKNPATYHKFFRWKKHYSYHLRHESPDTDDLCNFCAMINNDQLMKKVTVYNELNKWWTGENIENVCSSGQTFSNDYTTSFDVEYLQ